MTQQRGAASREGAGIPGRGWLVVLACFVAFIVVAVMNRITMFADGSPQFLEALSPYPPVWPHPRLSSHLVLRIPVLAAVQAGVTNFRLLQYLYSVGMLGHFALMVLICWKASVARREFFFFPLASFFLVSANLIYFTFSGAHLVVSGYWALLFVLLLPERWSVGWFLVATLSALALVASYESMAVMGWILIGAALWRVRRESSPVLKAGAMVVALVLLTGVAFAALGIWQRSLQRFVKFDPTDGGINGMVALSVAAFLLMVTGWRWRDQKWHVAMAVLAIAWVGWLLYGAAWPEHQNVWAQHEVRLLNMIGTLALSVPFFMALRARNPSSDMMQRRAWKVLTVVASAQLTWLVQTSWQWSRYLGVVAEESQSQAGLIPYESSRLLPREGDPVVFYDFTTGWNTVCLSVLSARDGHVRGIIANPVSWTGWSEFDPYHIKKLFYLKRYGYNFDEYVEALVRP